MSPEETPTVEEDLSAEERDILDQFQRGELRSVAGVERELEAARQAAGSTLSKTRRVSSGHPVDESPTGR